MSGWRGQVSWERRQMYVRRILAMLERRMVVASPMTQVREPGEESGEEAKVHVGAEQVPDVPEDEIPF